MRAMGILCGVGRTVPDPREGAWDGRRCPRRPSPVRAARGGRGRGPRRGAGGLLKGPATVPRHWSKYQCPDDIPDGATYYIVVKGDTLWDISQALPAQSLPLAADLEREPVHHRRPLDLSRRRADHPGGRARHRPRRRGRGRRSRGGEGCGRERGAVRAGGRSAHPRDRGDGACSARTTSSTTARTRASCLVGTEDGATKNAFGDRDILYLNKGSNPGVKAGDVYTLHHVAYTVKHPDTQPHASAPRSRPRAGRGSSSSRRTPRP